MEDDSKVLESLAEEHNDSMPSPSESPSATIEPNISRNETSDVANAQPTEPLMPANFLPPRLEETQELDLLGEQFDNYMRIAKALLTTLKRPKDVDICNKLIRKVQKLNNSKHVEVRRNNNRFFQCCLRVLKWTSENQPLHLYHNWYHNRNEKIATEHVSENWIEENKSYMSTKLYKDGTFLVYTAAAYDPAAGWASGGLKVIERQGVCENFKNNV